MEYINKQVFLERITLNKTLIIGRRSQLSHYLRGSLSSFSTIYAKDIDKNTKVLNSEWDTAYLTFGESRKEGVDISQYDLVNYELTKKYIDSLRYSCKKIVCFSTCELWSNYSGPVDISMKWNYKSNPYTDSKRKISEYILELNSKNVIVLYPFNFNSPLRTTDFLFGKVFQSILNKKKITLGNTNFKRDIIHPKNLTKRILEIENHEIIGSGHLTHVRHFVNNLYSKFNMNASDWINEVNTRNDRNITEYYSSTRSTQTYKSLLEETFLDLKNYEEQKWETS